MMSEPSVSTASDNVVPQVVAHGSHDTSRTARLWLGVAFVSVCIAATAWFSMNRAPKVQQDGAALPVLATAPEFELIAHDGRQVTRSDLTGKIWVADFIFTRCAGPCPTLSARMRSLQLGLSEMSAAKDVKLVSFSVDPLTDTPAVLTDYARRFHADTDRWWFLTNDDEPEMHRLIEKGFLQSVEPATDDVPLMHSAYLVLVDQQGRIRAFYDGLDPTSKTKILHDVETLLAESND